MSRVTYVPILRWKRAEQKALERVDDAERSLIKPLLEFTPRDYRAKKSRPHPTVTNVALSHIDTIEKVWGGRPAFVDYELLPSRLRSKGGAHPLRELARLGENREVSLIPVATLRMQPHEYLVVREAERRMGQGVGIRLKRRDLIADDLPDRVKRTMGAVGVSRATTDLLMDYEVTSRGAPAIASILTTLGSPQMWRSTVAISGAFPKDLTGFSPGEHLHHRADLAWWRSQISKGIAPTDAFGDYTIQYPLFSEPPEFANFSASIRYTTDDHWVVMRGEGVFNDDGPGFAQWPANAQLLCDRHEYCGPSFSYGDRYISEMSRQQTKTGNAETWLRAGLNHHLVFTTRQLANLFENEGEA